jgi:signal transduction histidine kinase
VSRDLSRLVAAPSPREVRRRVEVGGTHLELRQAPLHGRGGERFGRIVVCRDLTAQRRTERKLQDHAEKLQLSKVMLEQAYHRMEQLNSDLTARTEELRTLNEELQTLDEMKSNLLGNVSHELQTPLVAIRGYTEMILKRRLGPVTDEQRKGLELSLTNIDRLISMIDNLLVFSRPDGPQPRLIEFPLRPLIDECVVLLEEKRRAKRVRVDVAVQGGDVRVRGDRDKIQQVFINLLSNAIKFNHEDGVVRISVRGDESTHAEIIIEDTGPGIVADELERVFERHYRARGSAAGPEGSGIGLSIVRDILRLHGCTIRAESEPGQGARFRFGLPLADAPETSAAPSPDPAPPRPVAPPAESRPPVEPTEPTAPTEPEEVEGPEPPRKPRAASARRPRFRIIRPLE